ncbi:ROK family protein [Kitasatospora sp. NPDC101801]|uniref:ROK family protein n=1 Tax=Kitasatospora sp. NPDC101801 TaxID=3364103 RepID=UPI00380BE77A
MTAPTASQGFSAEAARRSRRPVLVLDLGGTWFRAGVLTADGTVVAQRRDPALTVTTHPGSVTGLQHRITDWLVRTADALAPGLAAIGGAPLCAVSLGAAMNGLTGEVLGSAPLFGSASTSWWPAAELATRRPGLRWSVVNDVSALAYALLVDTALPRHGKAAALTVSTGIAYRTIDLATGHVPLDPHHGLQGEIGHLPAQLTWEGRPVAAHCDCGAPDHVAALASGAGIGRFLRSLPAETWGGRTGPGTDPVAAFTDRAAAGHPGALRVLDAVTLPLARVLLAQATLDPEVGLTVLTGGVVDGLGDVYLDSLLRNLAQPGPYGIADRDRDYFTGRIVRGRPDGLTALRGAGVHARGIPNERVHSP